MHRAGMNVGILKKSSAGVAIDVQRVLFNLHRKLVPTEHLATRAQAYVDKGLISEEMAKHIMDTIKIERNSEDYINEIRDAVEPPTLSNKLNHQQLEEELKKRVEMMKTTRDGEADRGAVLLAA